DDCRTQRREQVRKKLRKCGIAVESSYTQTIRERFGITIVEEHDPRFLSASYSSPNRPNTKQCSQPIGQHSYFSHFRIPPLEIEIEEMFRDARQQKHAA